MNILPKVEDFITAFEQSVSNNSFIKLSLGNYHGSEENLKNIYVKRILIKKEEKFSFTYRYKTRDIVKNYSLEEVKILFESLIATDFHVATLFTNSEELQFEILKNNKVTLKRKTTEIKEVPLPAHDHTKNRLISSENKPYLHELNITDKDGTVYKKAQDKFRQINHYIEILSALVKEIPTDTRLNVADMGSGKGYLTFALYDYLQNVLHVDAHVTGVEFRPDLVSLCNDIAKNSNFKNLHFEEGSIESFNSEGINMLIALHACDTATDDAVFKGISAGSDLIVVAPCCHKQIRREIEKNKTVNDVQFLTRYGIFLERQAEMVTDGIRALILEYFGYKTKVFEFISDAHTPKNVLIVGTKDTRNAPDQPAILQKIRDAKQYFGIGYHHLEKITGLQSHQ
ncbi:class I SAM-dependent methyltransferase [Dyadobacter fanqingshengii]|uniref:SAM-dependent methyltransferase n=1 Tax=Dyadobacter fanqingshengii TaxID=2906443 RepID=A0A9X1TGQ9_9BACT|nr:SAM-dependent methyltransferase [Dyadobacter fanqingshengii]MCF0040702.1 SAM-dependent methyltransferase [Dyadobacter fanqingshengii]USJ37560.1 SAM-dependent methyltransferase [Dyadobacter fanqingshengii]